MSKPITKLSRAAKTYVAGVVVAGLVALAQSAVTITSSPPPRAWVILAALTLLTGSLTLKVPTISARLSISEVFVFAAVLWFGPSVATFIVALDTLVGTLWLRGHNRSTIRALFNLSAGVSAIWIASHLFELVASGPGHGRPAIEDLLLPVTLLGVTYFGINSFLIAAALSFEREVSPIELWRRNFLWLGLNHLVGASVAVMLVAYTPSINVPALSVIVPLLVITYLMFRMSLGRLDDAHRHVTQVNEMYLATIEALALAVDAKDQITHGHIRRVQVYTVELAKRLGVRDTRQLKAIEAAALLHDMGKLAIPEHILNKPGKLTTAEFDKMKRHADIGADLLSSIKFPYPVVPIVRHHHENWDGKGYPTGISGTDIPLGARILSVVDCFDALTSDRPYRPRLSTDDAFDILRQRRGTMYDPLVVDTFIDSYQELAPLATEAGLQARSLVGEATFAPEPEVSALNEIRANASEVALLELCGQQIATATSSTAAVDSAWQTLRQLTPVTTCALYRYESNLDQVVCQCSSGDPHNLLAGLVIRLGERVTGWCAANQKSAMNSDAHLDLIQMATRFAPPLRSTICVPVLHEDRLIGVFTGYSTQDSPFEERHRYAVERVAELLSKRLTSAAQIGSNIRAFPTSRHQ
jgi:putative nucleotidyltransferase with HDIG domain